MSQKRQATNKTLFTTTAVIEVGAGLVLAAWPSALVWALLGSALDTPAALTVGRLAGAALLALALACWLARHDGQSGATTGLAGGMLLYNAAAVALLAFAGIGLGLAGVFFWPAVVLHAGMAVWCFACLRSQNGTAKRRHP